MATNQIQAAIGKTEWFAELNQILDTLGVGQQVDPAITSIPATVEVATGLLQTSTNDRTELPNLPEVNTTTQTGKESPSTNERCLKRCTPCVNPPNQAPPSKRKRPNPKKKCPNPKAPEVTKYITLTVSQPYPSLVLREPTTMPIATTLIPILTPNGPLTMASGFSTLPSTIIDPLPFLSEVFDTVFAPCIPGSSDFEKKIRSAVMKKVLLDSSHNALTSVMLNDIEDVIQFIFNRFREISYLPN